VGSSVSTMDEQRQCLVCSVSINSTRLGMDTCRACASFFKRAIVAGAQYLCRQGTFNCSSTRTNKFMCRYCRLTTCYRSGHGVRGADSSQEGLDPCASFRGIQSHDNAPTSEGDRNDNDMREPNHGSCQGASVHRCCKYQFWVVQHRFFGIADVL
ncbi:hypothetical protein PRIPAC_78481, partial [Pristionchus pacificus]